MGLIRPNPGLGVSTSKHAAMMNNYNVLDDDATISLMIHQPKNACEMVSLDVDGMKSQVPKMTKSNVVSLLRRAPKTKRILRETIMEMPPEAFTILKFGSKASYVMSGIVASFKREEMVDNRDTEYDRFSITQVPATSPVFKVTSEFYKGLLGGDVVSRKDMISAAKSWLRAEKSSMLIDDTWVLKVGPLELTVPHHGMKDYKELVGFEVQNYKKAFSSVIPLEIIPINKRDRSRATYYEYMPDDFIRNVMQGFKATYLPKCFGGETDIHPLTYLECEMMVRTKYRSICWKKQKFKMTLLECDMKKPLIEMLISSNFCEGTRLSYDTALMVPLTQKTISDKTLSWIVRNISDENIVESMKRPRTKHHADVILNSSKDSILKGKSSGFDLTSLLNIHFESSDYSIPLRQTIEILQRLSKNFNSVQEMRLSEMERPTFKFGAVFSANISELRLRPKFDMISDGEKTVMRIEPHYIMEGGVSKLLWYDIQVYLGKKFIHNVVDVSNSNPLVVDKDAHEIRTVSLSSLGKIDVRITNVMGYLCLTTLSGVIISVLCSALLSEKFTYYLVERKGRSVHYEKDLEFLRDYGMTTADDLANMYSVMEGYTPEDLVDLPEELPDSDVAMSLSGGFDFDDFMADFKNESKEDAQNDDDGDSVDYDSDGSEFSSKGTSYSEARSEFAIQPNSSTIGSIIDQDCFKKSKLNWCSGSTVYKVLLPCRLPTAKRRQDERGKTDYYYEGDDEVSALSKMIDAIKLCEETKSESTMSYLCLAMRQCPEYRTIL